MGDQWASSAEDLRITTHANYHRGDPARINGFYSAHEIYSLYEARERIIYGCNRKKSGYGDVGFLASFILALSMMMGAFSSSSPLAPLPVMPMPQSDAGVQPAYSMIHGEVMTDEQLETLRRQISVYATISQQLVEMHKAIMAQQGVLPGFRSIPFDPAFPSAGQKLTSRQRWTPSQTQLQILEKLFEKGSGTPNKQRIKEITQELSQHGQISETNVYNWFQNRRARTKRKQQLGGSNNGESEIETEVDSPEEKGAKMEREMSNETLGAGQTDMNIQTGDSPEHYQFNTQKGMQLFQMHEHMDNSAVSFSGAMLDGHGYPPGSLTGVDLLVDCKPWGVSAFMLDIKANPVGTSVSQEYAGQMAMSNGTGNSLKLMHNGENYGHVE